MEIYVIAKIHARTYGAIRSRLKKNSMKMLINGETDINKIMKITGLSKRTIECQMKWLKERDENSADKEIDKNIKEFDTSDMNLEGGINIFDVIGEKIGKWIKKIKKITGFS